MRLATFTLCTLIALAGCNKASDAAPAATEAWPSFDAPAAPKTVAGKPMPKACELVNAEQVSALLRLEAGLMADDPENCVWAGSSGVGNMTMFMVQISESEDLAMAQTVFNSLAEMQGKLSGLVNSQTGDQSKKSGREIEDLGDEAWLASASFGERFGAHQVAGQTLTVRKGTRLLSFNVTNTTQSDGLGKRLEALARGVIEQL